MGVTLNLSSGVRELPEEGPNLVEVGKAEFRENRGEDKKSTTLYLEASVVGSEGQMVFQEQNMGVESAFYIISLLEAFGYDFPEETEARKKALADVEINTEDFTGKQAICFIEHDEYAGKPKANVKSWARPGSVEVVNA